MTDTNTHCAFFILAILLHTSAQSQDGIAWLPQQAAFNIRTNAHVILHSGQHAGTSFGLINRVDVPVSESASIEAMTLFEGKHVATRGLPEVSSMLACGVRRQWELGGGLLLPVHAGIASVQVSATDASSADRRTAVYLVARPAFRLASNLELLATAGTCLQLRDHSLQPSCTIGLRIGSVFSICFDVAGLATGSGRTARPLLL